jgi:type I restriction enzyme S subunit
MSHYKPYPAYRDSGVEWIGEVPVHWRVCKLKHLGRLKGGAGFPPDLQGNPHNEIAFYKVSDLAKSEDGINLGTTDNTITYDQAKILGATVFAPGTLAWAKIGAALSLNRRRVVQQACCLDNNMTGFVVDRNVVSSMYAYYLMSVVDFSIHAKPGAVPSFSEGDQGDLSVPCSAQDEQDAIVGWIERQTTRIDALVTKKIRFIELLKEKRSSLITHAVTKGLDPKAKMRNSGVDWIGAVPEHWQVARIKRAAFLRNERRNDAPSGQVYIGLEDVESCTGKYSPTAGSSRQSEESTVGTFRDGDILYGKLRPYLRKAIVAGDAGICTTEFLVLQPKTVLSNWLHKWLLTTEVTQQIESGCDGAKMPRADWEHVGSIHIPVPLLEEQRLIISALEKSISRIDLLCEKTQHSIGLLKERRYALVTAAVTGQIDLRNQSKY